MDGAVLVQHRGSVGALPARLKAADSVETNSSLKCVASWRARDWFNAAGDDSGCMPLVFAFAKRR
jgi:hypothetical protein